jgi:hypothetical protein
LRAQQTIAEDYGVGRLLKRGGFSSRLAGSSR